MEGPGCALPQYLLHSLRAERHLERKERELPRAFAWASVHAVGVLRGGVAGTEEKCAKRIPQSSWLFARRDCAEDLGGRLLDEMQRFRQRLLVAVPELNV